MPVPPRAVSYTHLDVYKRQLNAFDCPYSNVFTEGTNNKIKVIKRNAYGFRNFENFRNRILITSI